MNLTKEIQTKLQKLGSKIELSKIVGNKQPYNYAFDRGNTKRSFTVEFGKSKNEYSIVLFEKIKDLNYSFCHFRGVFNSLDRISKLIIEWNEKNEDISIIKKNFNELEQFEFFKLKNKNPEIEKYWNKIKNSIFFDCGYWKNEEWNNRYIYMLEKLKSEKYFENYYPFTSVMWLRFSLNKELTKTWELDLFIVPSVEKKIGNYVVGVPKSKEPKYFKNLETAIEFYKEKLNEHKIYNW